MLYSMLTHPAYGGAYAYGRTEQLTSMKGASRANRYDANRGRVAGHSFRGRTRAM